MKSLRPRVNHFFPSSPLPTAYCLLIIVVAWLPAFWLPAMAGRGSSPIMETRRRVRDLGVVIGHYPPGKFNAITDVAGVKVGQVTRTSGSGKLIVGRGPVRTGVTVILPTSDDFWHNKVPAGSFVLNGNGELTGLYYVQEFGYLETPIVFTDTLAIGRALDGAISYMVRRWPAIGVSESTINPIVGESDNSLLNDIQGRHVQPEDVVTAAESARDGPVAEGAVGGGTGMICYEFKCGIGTASRILPEKMGGYAVGAIVQANFGRRRELRVDGVPVGQEIADLVPEPHYRGEGSILIAIATDAPLTSRQLNRLARRAAIGVARTGTVVRDGSGDLFIAFSTGNRIPDDPEGGSYTLKELLDWRLNSLFAAAEEAVEEAILNSLTMAQTMKGRDDHVAYAMPLDRLQEVMRKYGRWQRQ